MQEDVEKNNGEANEKPKQPQGQEFAIQHIYMKDLSFESPNTPALFLESLKPQTEVELNVKTNTLTHDVYEVEVIITVTMKSEEKVAFLVEVHQAGIFGIKGFSPAQVHRMLGSYCPNVLFPYAREAISSIVTRGGFAPFYLTPINFDKLYEDQVARQAQSNPAQVNPEPEQKT